MRARSPTVLANGIASQRHHRVAADEGVPADAAELVHARPGADGREVLDVHVAAERRRLPEDDVAADLAVVRHVGAAP